MDKNRFWQLLEKEHPKAEGFCRRLAGNRDDGDDLYQDAIITAWRNFPALREIRSFKPWLYRIIVNGFNSKRRKLKNLKEVSLKNDTSFITNDSSARIFARLTLNEAFKAIKPEDRSLILLYEIEGWSIPELSTMFGKPSGTIKARLSRARMKMRRRIFEMMKIKKENPSKAGAKYAL